MPKPGQQHAISDEDRQRYNRRHAEMKAENPSLTLEDIGRAVGLRKSNISGILNGTLKQSSRKPALDKFFGGRPEDDRIAREILQIIVRLNPLNRAKLHERALALLDEQQSSGT
jgi:hypothetical protein